MVWRACEIFSILPPTVKNEWSENHEWNQCLLLGYSQIRDIENNEKALDFLKVICR